jgi:hypothetical protein
MTTTVSSRPPCRRTVCKMAQGVLPAAQAGRQRWPHQRRQGVARSCRQWGEKTGPAGYWHLSGRRGPWMMKRPAASVRCRPITEQQHRRDMRYATRWPRACKDIPARAGGRNKKARRLPRSLSPQPAGPQGSIPPGATAVCADVAWRHPQWDALTLTARGREASKIRPSPAGERKRPAWRPRASPGRQQPPGGTCAV